LYWRTWDTKRRRGWGGGEEHNAKIGWSCEQAVTAGAFSPLAPVEWSHISFIFNRLVLIFGQFLLVKRKGGRRSSMRREVVLRHSLSEEGRGAAKHKAKRGRSWDTL
jgi:hypothetical protein